MSPNTAGGTTRGGASVPRTGPIEVHGVAASQEALPPHHGSAETGRANLEGLDRHEPFKNLLGLPPVDKASEGPESGTSVEPSHPGEKDRVTGSISQDNEKAIALGRCGDTLLKKFEQLGQAEDILTAIECYRLAMSFIARDHPDKPTLLNNLGSSYHSRFERLGDIADLSMAIDYFGNALFTAPRDHPKKPARLNNLGTAHRTRFDRLGDMADLDLAVDYLGQAVSMTPPGDPKKTIRLSNLGVAYQSRFERLGNQSDLGTAISNLEQAVSLAPMGHPSKYKWLNNLGSAYRSLFKWQGQLSDLDKAIECHVQGIPLVPAGHLDKLTLFSNIGLAYGTRFKHSGRVTDLNDAVAYTSQAVELTPEGSPDKPTRLSNLATSYETRFERFGDPSDLGSAIDYANQAVSLTPTGDPELPIRLGNLGNSYSSRFEELGHLADLDEAISCHNRGVLITPQGHPQQPTRLNNLGISHRHRFDYLGDLKDIDLAIDYEGQAVSSTPEGHPERSQWLNSLGLSYLSRHEHLGHAADIDLAISSLSQSVSHTPEEHTHKSNHLKSLGDSHNRRFEHLGNLADLDMAILYLGQAVLRTPEGHREQPSLLNSLAISYQSRFERLANQADLNKAIEHFNKVAHLLPTGHRDSTAALFHLSYALYNRSKISGDPEDIAFSLAHAERAAKTSAGRALTRFNAARTWGSLCIFQQTSPIEAYRQLMKLIPEVVWLGSTADRRYENVSFINNAVMDASTIAIELQNYDIALEWLEEGRSIVWNQLLQLRTPLDKLATIDPSLAEELKQVAHDLEASFSSHPPTKPSSNEPTPEQAAQQHRRLAEQRELLIERARSLPGMSDFLRAKKSSSLLAASRTGVIAFINVHRRGCHAIIIRSPSAGVDCLPLTNLTYEKASIACAQLTRNLHSQGCTNRSVVFNPEVAETMGDALLMLWVNVAKPVLDFLGYTRNVQTDKLPHIIWCTTGPLSFLPLHAAGDYSKPGCALFDYAISSYTPTLSALLAPAVDTTAPMGVLAVGQAHTPSLPSLPGTVAELDQVSLQTGHMGLTRLEADEATASAVLTALSNHTWVHFACHASQDTTKPTASAFHLHNGPLSMAAITQKQLKNADLAFLSACETAAGDESMPEEAVHLAAGMIMAGYRRVIATMWSINDEDAPLVAEKFYAYMLDEGAPSENKAAKALHYAVGCLRAKVGVENFRRWAPYIHIGL